jgi:hypothetical protein
MWSIRYSSVEGQLLGRSALQRICSIEQLSSCPSTEGCRGEGLGLDNGWYARLSELARQAAKKSGELTLWLFAQ